ncbi:diguanylate cyclase (GGDEF domain) [hydrothermal vent metagenome]|uniref:Diguanylate cyclase (GGDEF domain) n=1 Tax=hydrothermal vent metagenome TaxID=652676 RepID=A0A1W1C0K8_9ZZZZ
MAQAAQTHDVKKLTLLHHKLYNLLKKDYQTMRPYGMRQLHFHLPNAISFIRFHRPNKYGDSLLNIRQTLAYVNKYKIPLSAFEEGRIFNGFRNVYPLFKGKTFVGTVEISFSFSALQEFLTQTDHTSYLFILKRQIIAKKVWNDEKKNYKKSEFQDYDYDIGTLDNRMQMRLNKMYAINGAIAKKINKKLAKGNSFAIYFHRNDIYEDAPILITFIAVPNLDNKTVAYIINYQFADMLPLLIKNINMVFISLTLFLLLLSIIVGIYTYKEQKRREKIYTNATHDVLTGLYNRYAINYFFGQKIDESKRYNKPLSIIFCDIDFFKKVNDTYGHDMGDYVLKGIAKILKNNLRSSDISARWGGEEFLIFLPETPLNEAVKIAQKLRKLIEESLFSSIQTVTCSFGVTELKKDDNANTLLKRVDKLLYKAKENGRNRIESD